MTDFEIVTAMLRYGGSFAQALGRCWQAADAHNQQRIRVAFADVWLTYGELAERRAADGRAIARIDKLT